MNKKIIDKLNLFFYQCAVCANIHFMDRDTLQHRELKSAAIVTVTYGWPSGFMGIKHAHNK